MIGNWRWMALRPSTMIELTFVFAWACIVIPALTDPHLRYYQFLEYGDAECYRNRLHEFRQRLRTETQDADPAAKPISPESAVP